MNIIIIYYSYTGTTKKYVEYMQGILDCDLLEIKPKEDIKVQGFRSYFVGGYKSLTKQTPELEDYTFNKDEYDLIIIASPIWAFTYTPAIRSFLENENIHEKVVSYFMTHRGGLKHAHIHFGEALHDNKILHGLDINAKDSEESNYEKIEDWLGGLHEY